MLDVNNVKFVALDASWEYQMPLQPFLDPFPPIEHLQHDHPLAGGLDADFHIGYKFRCSLLWSGNNFFRGTQFDELRTIYNKRVAFYIYPAPDTNPNCFYKVKWVNSWDFQLVRGSSEYGYHGTIELRGQVILSEIDEYLAMANT